MKTHQLHFYTVPIGYWRQKFYKIILHYIIKNHEILFLTTTTKYLYDLCTGNDQTLLKEIKEDPNKWRDTSYLWLGRFNVKMSFLPNWISIKILVDFFGSSWQPDFNIQMKMQWTYSTKTSLKELKKSQYPISRHATKLQ